jgi:Cof subfamily protein (haloacid dehalogenase superfamily)
MVSTPSQPPQPPPPISLLLADVDGTLVTNDKILTSRAAAAVEALHARGIAFAITSGRPPRGMAMLIEPLHLTTPIAAFNGGIFVHPDMTVIDQHALPDDVVPRVIKVIRSHDLDVWLYRGADWYTQSQHGPHVDREEWTVKFPPIVVPNYDALMTNVVKIVGVSDDLEAVARCEADAQQQLGTRVTAERSQPYYLDVTHPDANKGMVAKRLSQFLNIPLERIATIGDQMNDTLMFKVTGLSIAMGNASDEVKHLANKVTTSYEDEGFANAVEWFILGTAVPPAAVH